MLPSLVYATKSELILPTQPIQALTGRKNKGIESRIGIDQESV